MQGKKSKEKSKIQIQKALDLFLAGCIEGKFGRYVIDGNRLVYRMAVTQKLHVHKLNREVVIHHIQQGNIVPINHTVEEIKQLDIVHTWLRVKMLQENEIARRLTQDGRTLYIGNADALPIIGRKIAFGRVTNNYGATEVQNMLSTRIPMIGFKLFDHEGEKELRMQIETWKHIVGQEAGYLETEKAISGAQSEF